MPVLLYIDTSAEKAAVFVSKDSKVAAVRRVEEMHRQAAMINVMIDEALKQANCVMDDMDGVAVCAGPGSYTGLRVALSTAKGLCFALDKPLMLFNKPELLAMSYRQQTSGNIWVALKARSGEYFAAKYGAHLEALQEPRHFFAEDLQVYINKEEDVIVTDDKDAAIFYNYPTISTSEGINFAGWVQMAEAKFAAEQFADTAYSEPFYLKAAFTTTPKKKS